MNVFLLAAMFFTAGKTAAQSIVVDDTYTAQQLVDALVDNSCAQISNVQVKGWNSRNSYGYFTAPTGFPFESGILLSSGAAKSAEGPNTSDISDGTNNWPGDSDLQNAVGIQGTMNATVLEFDFVPVTGSISFDFIFFSEEYKGGIGCDYSDAFAFLLKPAGSIGQYQNLAVIPGTQTPVMVTSVRGAGSGCPSANINYFDRFNNSSHQTTNFNGQTKIFTAKANVIAGNLYHIKLVIADQTDTMYDSAIFLGANSFTTSVDLGTERLLSTNNPLCDTDILPLNATTPGALGYQWYKNGTLLPGETGAGYTIRDAGDYSVMADLGTGCFAESKIKVEYAAPPPVVNHTLLQCADNTGLTVYDLTKADNIVAPTAGWQADYYTDSVNAGLGSSAGRIVNKTAFYNTVPNQVVYARVQDQYGCYSISTVQLLAVAAVAVSPQVIEKCDAAGSTDGVTDFDLTIAGQQILQNQPAGLQLAYYTTEEDALLSTRPITGTQQFTNTTPFEQTVYARLENSGGCYAVTEIKLVANIFAVLPPEEVIICAGHNVTLDAGSQFTAFAWNTQPVVATRFLTVDEPGTYTVSLTNTDGCTGTRSFTVLPSGVATGADVAINDFAGDGNSITITPKGPGDYEYSINGADYFDEPYFTGLAAAEYTIYIKDKNGCNPVYTDVVYVMDYPRFFTPNGDNVNDVWRIPFMQFQQGAAVTIFDRFGKLITRFGATGSWNGTFNGTPLPSTDYWFVITLQNGRTIRGHFAMMR